MTVNRALFRWEKDFTGTVLKLAVPIIIQSLFASLMHIVDNVMIGRLGEAMLEGVTQADRVTFFYQVTLFGVVSGTSVLTAQYWGSRDVRGVRATMGLGMMTALFVGSIFCVAALAFPGALMGLLLKRDAASLEIQTGISYLRVIGLTYLVQSVSMVQSATLRSSEQVKLPMAASIIGLAVNTFLSFTLIFGQLGFPRVGPTGGAIGALVGCVVELGVILAVGYRNNLATAARLKELLPRAKGDIARFFRIVFPTAVNETFWSLGMVMYSIAYGHMAVGTVAAVSIFNNIEGLAFITARGATHACAVMVGNAIGEGRPDRAEITAKRMMLITVAAALVVGLIVFLVGGLVVGLFVVSDETASSARMLINIFACVLWIHASASMLIVGVLRAGGDVNRAALYDVLPVWLIGVPLAFLLGPVLGWPIQWVYLATRGEELVKVALSFKRLLSGKWVHNLIEGG